MKLDINYLNVICEDLIREGREADKVEYVKDYIIKYNNWTTIKYLEEELYFLRRNKYYPSFIVKNNVKNETSQV